MRILCPLIIGSANCAAAEKVIDRLVEIQKSVLGVQNEETIKSLHLSDKTQVELRNHDDAIMLFVEAADASIGTNSESTLEVNESLVQCLCERGRYEEAKMLLEQLVDPLPMEPRGSQLMSHLFNARKLLYETGRYASAESCFEKASNFREELYGLFHEQTLDATLRLAYSLAKQTGKAGKIRELLAENGSVSLPLDRKISVINHIFELGKIQWGRRAYAEAYETFDQVVRERKQFQFQGDRQTLVAASWMGRSLLGRGQHNDAIAVLKSVLKEQPDISWVSIDGTHRRQRESTKMAESAWKEHSDDVWAGYLDAAYTSLWLGESLHCQGKREESHTYIRRAYYMIKQCLGDSHADTIRSMRCYGSSQGTLDEFWAAQHTLSSDHPLTLKSRRDVEKCNKVLAGKWVFPLPHKRRKLEYRHL